MNNIREEKSNKCWQDLELWHIGSYGFISVFLIITHFHWRLRLNVCPIWEHIHIVTLIITDNLDLLLITNGYLIVIIYSNEAKNMRTSESRKGLTFYAAHQFRPQHHGMLDCGFMACYIMICGNIPCLPVVMDLIAVTAII